MALSKSSDAAIGRLAVAVPLLLNLASGELDRQNIGSCFKPPIPDAFFTILWSASLLSLLAIVRSLYSGRGSAAAVGLFLLASANLISLYSLGDMAQHFAQGLIR